MPERSDRDINRLDGLLIAFDRALRGAARVDAGPTSESPAGDVADDMLDDSERRHSAGLMRVNHAGEVAAQALYRGQSLVARDPGTREAMEQAAREENDHLVWCRTRLEELGSAPSLLDPLWFAGSLAIGAAAGLAGDRWSLGFIVETERQGGGRAPRRPSGAAPRRRSSKPCPPQANAVRRAAPRHPGGAPPEAPPCPRSSGAPCAPPRRS